MSRRKKGRMKNHKRERGRGRERKDYNEKKYINRDVERNKMGREE